jgi:glycosyltransferase involved in cell wall biosynthesis
VLQVLNELRASGAEVMLAQVAPVWRERGITADVLATAPVVGFYAGVLSSAGYGIRHLPCAGHPRYLAAFRRLVADGGYDVVHVHAERGNFWHAAAARTTGAAVARTVHNVFDFAGVLRLERFVQRAALRAMGVQTVSVSTSVRDVEWARYRNPTVCISNWIDVERFQPATDTDRSAARQRLGVEAGTVVATVGNCAPAKNHEVILHALAHLDDGWVYVHVGEERPDGAERRLAEALGVASRCRWLGRVEDVRAILAGADVFAMPSRYEGLGNAAVEAVAMGLPCVLADVPGLRDLRGLPGPLQWTEPTAAAVVSALEAVRARQHEAGIAHDMHRAVQERFGIDRGGNAYAALYAQVAGRAGG